jgi:D-tyrosyl-tRNA(Tyr) deacylase
MRILIQRVSKASVTVGNEIVGSVSAGALVLLGIHKEDTLKSADWLVSKLINLRMFSDGNGRMNLSLKDISGQVLIVSQFTLYGDCSSGKRPDFFDAAKLDVALPLYLHFIQELKKQGLCVETGQFGADMQVSLINDGPVTFLIDSKA